MTETTDTRADSTRQQILRAAAGQFARLPYHQVGLDDVLAEAELTKGAMYFHFRSKHALALAIIEDQIARSDEAITDLLARKLSGLETLIDFSYQLAMRDISEDISRVGAASGRIHRPDRGPAIQVAPELDRQPHGCRAARYRRGRRGRRTAIPGCRTSAGVVVHGAAPDLHLDEPDRFLPDFQKMWALMLPGFVRPERIDYFRQFIKRRTNIAIASTSALRVQVIRRDRPIVESLPAC